MPNSVSARSFFTLSLLAALITPTLSHAQAGTSGTDTPPASDTAPVEPPSPDNLPKGVIASQGNFAKIATVQDASSSNPSDSPNPVVARVTRTGSEECTASITNSAKDASYSVNIDILGLNPNGSQAMKKNIVATIGPGKTIERTMYCRKGLNTQVVIRSGSKK